MEYHEDRKTKDVLQELNDGLSSRIHTKYDFARYSAQLESEGAIDAQRRAWSNHYYRLYHLDPMIMGKKWAKALEYEESLRNDQDYFDTWYIVINPDPKKVTDTEDLESFIDHCHKAFRKTWIGEGKLWFEFRGVEYNSIHANFALTFSRKAFSQVRREFYSTFKKFVGKEDHPKECSNLDIWINIQQTKHGDYKRICNYQLMKNKFEHDKPMLLELGLKEAYWTGGKPKAIEKKPTSFMRTPTVG